MVSSQIISLMYSPIVFSWEAWNMKELAVSNFIILIIDKQISGRSAMPQRCTLVSMEEMRIEGGGDFPHVKKDGQYRIDFEATPTMLRCLIYLKKKTVKAMIMSGGPKHFKLTVRRV
ncbi:dolichyl-diphosphooligosaccharide--protein glycosyltransferase subunit STT3A-like [Raphanus sativus]|uniref:Dolichyl-diphosphooligosaccharide--protein glycosyltransferase subunit STT3A-like n=1 Tax=Raphanus sativus TaxID=3726 RepID=A0A9W3DG66_RAPSA|nr:dolichyl-diphosphooligosaccharide--protein glycosyltransferase subunit STT3A-like [Raphanus sativus]XP_056862799.1 dolichyl-diphosphooligosaccharide--protein glycosyltransferase subunit STT3A-like [Raphanus sativus]